MSSVLDDIKKRRTRQSVGEQPAVTLVEPVAPVNRPMGDQASARAGVAPQPQAVQPQVQEPVNRPMGDQASARVIAGGASVTPAVATTPVVAEPVAPKQMTYTDLHKELYQPMTPEEKAAQQKRQRNRQIINAVGDGISALANLYYTNRSGVNAYDPSTSLTKAAKERYDKLLAQQREDEERYKAMAYQAGAADLEMAYRRAKDAAADKRADIEMAYRRAKDAAADKRADDALQAAKEEKAQQQKNWQAAFDYGKEKDAADRTERAAARSEENAFKQQQQLALDAYRKAMVESKSTTNAVKQINNLYGKPIEFARPNSTNLEIYESVWKGSMPQVYAILASEATKKFDLPGHGIGQPTWNEMDAYVKKNWLNSERAKDLMMHLAGDTPARLISGIAENNSLGWGEDNSNNDELDW